jgi:hypothetical protein
VLSLADRLPEITRQTQCKTCVWYDDQPDRDKQAFEDLASRDDIATAYLYRLCYEEGLKCGESSFKRHMKTCRESR